MRKNFLEHGNFIHGFNPIHEIKDIKDKVQEVEKKQRNLAVIVLAGLLAVSLTAVIFALVKKGKCACDSFYDDEDFYGDDFDDDFEDLSEDDFE